jgi:hypothetical protein
MLAIMPTLDAVVNYANSRLGKCPLIPSIRMVRRLAGALISEVRDQLKIHLLFGKVDLRSLLTANSLSFLKK